MPSRIQPLLSSTALTPPFILFVASGKGGVGKSFCALHIADGCQLNDLPLHLIQVDTQARLGQAIGRDVETINVTFAENRRDPTASTRELTRIYRAAERAAANGTNCLVDFGPNEVEPAVAWMLMAEIAQDFSDLGMSQAVFVPAVGEPEALRQASRTLRRFAEALPAARLVFLENQRDGRFQDLHPASEAARIIREELDPQAGGVTRLVIPAIEAGSWRVFEAACKRFIDVIDMDVNEIMRLSGLSRPECRIIRGDVAACFAAVEAELAKVLPFSIEARS